MHGEVVGQRQSQRVGAPGSDPHGDRLADIFSIAGVGYGRIDYGVHAGAIQTWEINTNPMIMTEGDRGSAPRLPVQNRFAEQLEEALVAIDDAASDDGPPIRIGPPLLKLIAPWRSLRERIWHALYV